MNVLIVDKFEEQGLELIKAAGCDVFYRPGLKDAALVAALRELSTDVLVVRSTQVTASMMESGRLSLIVRAGAGVNTIDVKAASERGVYVSNCPGKNSIAVAELVFGLILALDRRIVENVSDLRQGTWNKKRYSEARGIFGQTIGILGLGNIGAEMVRRAHGFGLGVVCWDVRRDGEDRALLESDAACFGLDSCWRDMCIRFVSSPLALAEQSDIVSVHLALVPETRRLINKVFVDRLRPGACLINAARGELVDEEALEQAILEKDLRVGLDVFEGEPSAGETRWTGRLSSNPNVYGTHHIGASTQQAQLAIASETAEIIARYKTSGRVKNVVNLCDKTPATYRLIVRHRDRPGVLAHVFEHLRLENLNVQETENVIFDGAQAAIARINIDGRPGDTCLEKIREGNPDILQLQLVTLADNI